MLLTSLKDLAEVSLDTILSEMHRGFYDQHIGKAWDHYPDHLDGLFIHAYLWGKRRHIEGYKDEGTWAPYAAEIRANLNRMYRNSEEGKPISVKGEDNFLVFRNWTWRFPDWEPLQLSLSGKADVNITNLRIDTEKGATGTPKTVARTTQIVWGDGEDYHIEENYVGLSSVSKILSLALSRCPQASLDVRIVSETHDYTDEAIF